MTAGPRTRSELWLALSILPLLLVLLLLLLLPLLLLLRPTYLLLLLPQPFCPRGHALQRLSRRRSR